MSAHATLTGPFEAQRPRLLRLAYRMLGSRAEAEDIVQEAWLRWQAADRSTVAEPAAYLSRIVTRLCLDALKSARARRETYIGPWLPEPVAEPRLLVRIRALRARAGLETRGSLEFGESYSQTLRRWHETFLDRWERIQTMGFDDRFRRMWEFYLTGCAAAFHSGICDVTQITLRRPA